MTEYRRAKIRGATYFCTLNCAERSGNRLLVDRIARLRPIFRKVKSEHPFEIDAVGKLTASYELARAPIVVRRKIADQVPKLFQMGCPGGVNVG